MDNNMRLSEKTTYSTVLIHCCYENNMSGSGTGFVINLCENNGKCVPVVVTNNHVIKGCLKTTFEICLRNCDGSPNDKDTFLVDIPCNNWIRHPDANVDLCCLPIKPILNKAEESGKKLFYIPLSTSIIPDHKALNQLSALEEIIMVGYPRGISDEYNHKPIIRKGITATHIKNNYQGKKTFLIDMACFPGSSGSPIFVLNEGSYKDEAGYLCLGNRIQFVGVLFQGPQYTAQGSLMFSEIPSVPTPITQIPMNLGEAIKAEEILAFESLFSQEFNKENTNG